MSLNRYLLSNTITRDGSAVPTFYLGGNENDEKDTL